MTSELPHSDQPHHNGSSRRALSVQDILRRERTQPSDPDQRRSRHSRALLGTWRTTSLAAVAGVVVVTGGAAVAMAVLPDALPAGDGQAPDADRADPPPYLDDAPPGPDAGTAADVDAISAIALAVPAAEEPPTEEPAIDAPRTEGRQRSADGSDPAPAAGPAFADSGEASVPPPVDVVVPEVPLGADPVPVEPDHAAGPEGSGTEPPGTESEDRDPDGDGGTTADGDPDDGGAPDVDGDEGSDPGEPGEGSDPSGPDGSTDPDGPGTDSGTDDPVDGGIEPGAAQDGAAPQEPAPGPVEPG